ncbi:hypothetical protein C5167_041131 [Papaver somniferum]|uniref:Glycolipid transfer protein domain-containing protein n=1 Tax=Papaver somniferum TaxID=3469 RepID=A0A4Y7IL58_PAPSO|nr:accelerated cell death 11-like [Papaver somniferum]RZC48188.1 hypothetical protein C5167_041131 [Papaver somniferum]
MAPTLLRKMSVAFRDLAATVNQGMEMEVRPFAQACSYIASLVEHLGPHFRFAVADFEPKVANINAASQSFRTLKSMLEADIERNNVQNPGSPARNLLRFKRVIEVLKVLFEMILDTNFDDEGDNSMDSQGWEAYSKVFGKQHEAGLKTKVFRFLPKIPSKAQFLVNLEENEESCAANLRTIVEAAPVITNNINGLYNSMGLDLNL